MKKFTFIHEIKNFIINLEQNRGKMVIRLLFGNGDKKQYKDINKLRKEVQEVAHYTPKNRTICLYFGDVPKESDPDIGYIFEYLSKIRPDIIFIMIQIKEMEKYGVPKFVNGGVYFHEDYDEKHKWGGFEEINGKYKVYSNTKQWLKLHYLLSKEKRKKGISFCDVFGEGGDITKQELKLIDKLNYTIDKEYTSEIIINQFDLESRYEIQSKDWKDKTKI
jgi:hypothetical protein